MYYVLQRNISTHVFYRLGNVCLAPDVAVALWDCMRIRPNRPVAPSTSSISSTRGTTVPSAVSNTLVAVTEYWTFSRSCLSFRQQIWYSPQQNSRKRNYYIMHFIWVYCASVPIALRSKLDLFIHMLKSTFPNNTSQKVVLSGLNLCVQNITTKWPWPSQVPGARRVNEATFSCDSLEVQDSLTRSNSTRSKLNNSLISWCNAMFTKTWDNVG